ncbi:hypothetical protein LXA43DRAFT_1009939 [Ganoderma leucocontextum]|nr:hypothetical protein LXA43DRAFT_1009939 [Ganoderma leucocontextum]
MAQGLIDLNVDVQSHIISFLSSPLDLFALRRTSMYFLELTTSALCAKTKDMPLRCAADLVAFYRFLRIGDPSSRTAVLVKDLRFELQPDLLRDANSNGYQLPGIDLSEAVEAFTGILDHCRHLRRLHMVRWYPPVPPSLLYHALSNLTDLEELELNIDQDVETQDLLRLANLPLRRLVCLCAPQMASQFRHFAVFGPLARILVELELPMYAHKCKFLGATFISVRKLALWVSRGRAFVHDLHPTFPNLSHLTLRGQCPWGHPHGRWVNENGEATNEEIRRTHTEQWKGVSGAWPSLKSIRVEDPRTAYLLVLNRSVPCLSLTWLSNTPEHVFPTAVADTRPTCLEFVIDQQSYMGSLRVRQGPYVGLLELAGRPAATSSLRYLVVYFRRFNIPSERWCVEDADIIHLLASAVANLPVTHLMIKFDFGSLYLDSIHRNRRDAIVNYLQYTYDNEDGIKLLNVAETWVTELAGSSRTLQWIGVYVPRDRIRCWEVFRQAGGEEGEWETTLWEVDEDEAWEPLSAEPLREFT